MGESHHVTIPGKSSASDQMETWSPLRLKKSQRCIRRPVPDDPRQPEFPSLFPVPSIANSGAAGKML